MRSARLAGQTGPVSSPRVDAHDADAGLGVAGHDRPLDGRRAAPARQQRRVDVEELVVRQQRLADERAEGADDDDVGRAAAICARASSALTFSGWASSMPSARAASATGGATSLRPRPAGRSGRVTTSCGRCGESASRVEHLGRERRRAEVDRPLTRVTRARGLSASRSARIAALRCSRVVRSRIRMPSRWSISCWMTRASRPVASTIEVLAVLVPRAHEHRDRALDVDWITCGRLRQPSSLISSSLLDHSISGLTSATIGLPGSTR